MVQQLDPSSATGQISAYQQWNVALWAIEQAILNNSATFVSPPASSTSPGSAGSLAYDPNYLYVCVNTNSWRRVAITTW